MWQDWVRYLPLAIATAHHRDGRLGLEATHSASGLSCANRALVPIEITVVGLTLHCPLGVSVTRK